MLISARKSLTHILALVNTSGAAAYASVRCSFPLSASSARDLRVRLAVADVTG